MQDQTTTTTTAKFTSEPGFDDELSVIDAFTVIAAMQAAVDEVPSYVETNAYQIWAENAVEQQ